MIRNVTVAVLAVSLILPAASAAGQATPRRPSTRPRVRVETRDGPFTAFAYDSRGRIGVIVDTKANDAGDKVGARIEGITPGGPAEKAGLKAGDVITRFNGTDRKSTRLNSSHLVISYAVFCLKKKKRTSQYMS